MSRPRNILFILADQWRADSLSATGHPVVRTPHLDELAQDGVRFAQHYAQASPCGPSRTSILTGMYLQNHRSARNGTPLDRRFTNIALEMRKAGFDPGLIGYTDTSADPRGRDPEDPALHTYEGVMTGFTPVLPLPEDPVEWLTYLRRLGYDVPPRGREGASRPVANYPDAAKRGPTYAPAIYKAEHSDTAFVTDRAVDYIDARRDEPWFLHLVYLRPHPPFIAPEPITACTIPPPAPPFGAPRTRRPKQRSTPFYRGTCRASARPRRCRTITCASSGHVSGPDQRGRRADRPPRRLFETDRPVRRHADRLQLRPWRDARATTVYSARMGYVRPGLPHPADRARARRRRMTRASRRAGRRLHRSGVDFDANHAGIFAERAVPVQCDGSLAGAVAARRQTAGRLAPERRIWEFDFRDVAERPRPTRAGPPPSRCALNVHPRTATTRVRAFRGTTARCCSTSKRTRASSTTSPRDPRCMRRSSAALRRRSLLIVATWSTTERTLTGIHLTADGPVERPRERR